MTEHTPAILALPEALVTQTDLLLRERQQHRDALAAQAQALAAMDQDRDTAWACWNAAVKENQAQAQEIERLTLKRHDAGCELRGPGGAVDRRCNCGFRALRAELDTLRAERDAAQQEAEATVIAQVLAHWFTQGGEARFGSLSMPCTIGNLKATREPANADELVSQILAALSSPPRPQEPQPAEPKSSETRKPVVNLMEALKKSLDSLNANRTSQEPGGHQP